MLSTYFIDWFANNIVIIEINLCDFQQSVRLQFRPSRALQHGTYDHPTEKIDPEDVKSEVGQPTDGAAKLEFLAITWVTLQAHWKRCEQSWKCATVVIAWFMPNITFKRPLGGDLVGDRLSTIKFSHCVNITVRRFGRWSRKVLKKIKRLFSTLLQLVTKPFPHSK